MFSYSQWISFIIRMRNSYLYLNAAGPIERIGLPSNDVKLIRSKFVKDFDGKPRYFFPWTSMSLPSPLLEYPPNRAFSFNKRRSSLTVPLAKNESMININKKNR